jgi:peptide/nickel transport system permease protein
MWQYLLKRLLMLVVTLFGIAVISFLIVTKTPGDPASLKAAAMGKGRSSGVSEFTTRKNRELFFLDRPVLLNLDPATRTSTVAKTLAALDAPLEIERKDARSRLIGDLGTSALSGLVASLPGRRDRAKAELSARTAALAQLDQAADAELPAVLRRLAQAYPAYEPRLALVDGEAPPPAAVADVWRRQRKALLDEATAPLARALEVLSSDASWPGKVEGILPASRGGPAVAHDTSPDDAVAAWEAWWDAHRSGMTPAAAEAAAAAWLASGGDAEKQALGQVGQLAAPALMAALEDADEDSPAERRAAAGLAAVVKKPWTLELTPEEVERHRVAWSDRKAAIEADQGKLKAAVYERMLAKLGSRKEYVARERDAELDLRRHRWQAWWYRAEEYYVDFGAGAQAGRAISQTQFGRWMSRLVVFDFGDSYKHKRPVSELLVERLKVTLPLNVVSLALIYLIALPVGIFSATHQKSAGDRVSTVVLFLLYSIPSFWAGSMLIMLLTGEPFLDLFPAYGIESIDSHTFSGPEKLWDWFVHGTLPVVCLTYAGIAYVAKQMRAGMLEVVRQDYIRTARAKGLAEKVVIYKHALRNSLIPILTLMANLLPVLFGGSVIIESIFSLPGLGKLTFDAIFDRDYPVIMANLVISGGLTLFGILLTDIAYALVDPRIEYR